MITVSQYLSFLLKQISDARNEADKISVTQAIENSKNPIMKQFPVSRFRMPEVELNIPFLVSKTDVNTAWILNIEPKEFIDTVSIRINPLMEKLGSDLKLTSPEFAQIVKILNLLISRLIENSKNQDRIQITKSNNAEIDNALTRIFPAMLKISGKTELYNKLFPNDEPRLNLTRDIQQWVDGKLAIRSMELNNLLINPVTEAVKTESNEFSVFQIKAKLVEEAFFLSSVRDDSGNESHIVDFE